MTHLLRISCRQWFNFFDVKENEKWIDPIFWCSWPHTKPLPAISSWLKLVQSKYTAIINVSKIDKMWFQYKKISYAPGWSGVGDKLDCDCVVTICSVWVGLWPLSPDYSCNKIIYISHIGAVFKLLLACIKLFRVEHQSPELQCRNNPTTVGNIQFNSVMKLEILWLICEMFFWLKIVLCNLHI